MRPMTNARVLHEHADDFAKLAERCRPSSNATSADHIRVLVSIQCEVVADLFRTLSGTAGLELQASLIDPGENDGPNIATRLHALVGLAAALELLTIDWQYVSADSGDGDITVRGAEIPVTVIAAQIRSLRAAQQEAVINQVASLLGDASDAVSAIATICISGYSLLAPEVLREIWRHARHLVDHTECAREAVDHLLSPT